LKAKIIHDTLEREPKSKWLTGNRCGLFGS
jgi:hypothetical protein